MDARTPEHRNYWDSFYAGKRSGAVPAEPSAFARWTQRRLSPSQPIVEFGFGNGRDSLWFAREGHPVTGYDFASSAVSQGQDRAVREGLPARFFELDLYDSAATAMVAERTAGLGSPALFGRFLIHSLEEAGRQNLFDIAATALGASGGDLYLEFRTGKDQGRKHLFGDDHFRVYLDPTIVENELVDRGAHILHTEAGHGLSVYKTEDPHVARIVAAWTT